MNKIVSFTAGLISVWIIGSLLIAGRSLIVPVVIAIFIWHLLNTFHQFIQNLPIWGNKPCPSWLSQGLAFLLVILLGKVLVDIISNNVVDVIAAAPRYQENLLHIFDKIDKQFQIKVLSSMETFMAGISVKGMLVNFYAVFTALTSSAVLIALYVAFLFVEQHYFAQKMDALFPQKQHRNIVNNIINHIVKDTQTYLGLKTILSIITAFASWLIMVAVGLDFAEFWALLIFFLNFIPNIGAIIATIFPASLALIQFSGWLPFALIISGLTTVQFIFGNFVEPKFLSKSLNLSPLVILIALAFWGYIWGVLGMFLSVPITVMMMIIFAHFASTRPLAVMLSKDGLIQKAYEPIHEVD